MRRRTGLTAALAAVGVTVLMASMVGVARADSVSTGGFEGYDTAIGINGQDGWAKTGPYDVAIVDPHDFGIGDMGARALRLSNSVVSGSFEDQTFSKQLADEAGETSAEGDGTSGPRQRVFTATFSVRTTTPEPQPGLATSISPDRGDGARMSYLRLEDQEDGVHVFFDDYSRSAIDQQTGLPGAFVETDIANLSRGEEHTLGLTVEFFDGASNDVVYAYVDGVLKHTGTTWEDYFRDTPGQGGETRTVDSLLFREGGTAAPLTAGHGFLIDDVELGSSGTDCSFTTNQSTSTKTLVNDCITDGTVYVPDGYTLDGAGHTITAVDPVGGHWTGAVVANAGDEAHVTGLTVTTSALADVCDDGANRLRGIMLDGAAGSITDNTVVGIRQAGSGCQEGNAIEARNAPFDSTGTDVDVTIADNEVSDYQKTGVLVNGSVLAMVTGNNIDGLGPVPYIAQNGVQIGFGASATVEENAITDNWYTGTADAISCGLLIFDADGVKQRRNDFAGNQQNLCNVNRGGGKLDEG